MCSLAKKKKKKKKEITYKVLKCFEAKTIILSYFPTVYKWKEKITLHFHYQMMFCEITETKRSYNL